MRVYDISFSLFSFPCGTSGSLDGGAPYGISRIRTLSQCSHILGDEMWTTFYRIELHDFGCSSSMPRLNQRLKTKNFLNLISSL